MFQTPGEPPQSAKPGDRRHGPSPWTCVSAPTLPPEIVRVLRRTAEETIRRHQSTVAGRCSYCSATWLHTDTAHPCPPVRIAHHFLRLTGPDGKTAP